MTKQAMGELIDDLETNGYLERTSDPSDRRARLIRYTDKGRRALETAYEIIPAIEREYAEAIGPERYAEAKRALAELTESLQIPGE
jgi:DNA-binding MarR family transcriptional regulator